jgi:hypothetical protein
VKCKPVLVVRTAIWWRLLAICLSAVCSASQSAFLLLLFFSDEGTARGRGRCRKDTKENTKGEGKKEHCRFSQRS